MLTQRKLTKHAIMGAFFGSAIGSPVGTASGYIGLSQACKLEGVTKEMCTLLMNHQSGVAIATGCALGTSIGFAAGAAINVAYQSLVACCRNHNIQPPVDEEPELEHNPEADARVCAPLN